MILPSWTPSPGLKAVTDKAVWPDLEKYVKDVVAAFGRDKRLLLWDLYNEPGNSGMGDKSLPLVEATFAWARAASPSQPLTVSVWGGPAALGRRQLDLSDVTSFHFYGNCAGLRKRIVNFQKSRRPVVATEWMSRLLGSRWETDLPGVQAGGSRLLQFGAWSTAGRNASLRGTTAQRTEPKIWFHDLFHEDGKPYDPEEIKVIRHDEEIIENIKGRQIEVAGSVLDRVPLTPRAPTEGSVVPEGEGDLDGQPAKPHF